MAPATASRPVPSSSWRRAATWLAERAGGIRLRTTVLTTVLVAIVLIAASYALVSLQRRSLADNLESTIELRADDIADLLAQGAPLIPATSAEDDDVDFVQVVTAADEVVSSSENVAGLPAMLDIHPPAGDSETVRRDELAFEDDEFVVVARTVATPGGDRTIYVGGNLEEAFEGAESLVGRLRFGVPLLVLGVAVGTWFLVGRSLAPMERIRSEVAAMTGDDLTRRVPEPRARDEVGRLARTMNEMLDRVEGAYDRQQRFVADASHELRSPLATLQAQLEVAQSDPDARDWPATSVAMTREVERMQRLVDQLLFLARTDQDRTPEVRPVDLDDIVLEEARALAGRTNTRIDLSAVSAGQVLGDAEQLRRAVRNLLDNAIRHARTTVSLTLRETPERVELTVIDDGPGIPPEARERIFERFTRLDVGRSADRGGAGLGLAITRAIADAHHGTITLEPTHTAGTRFVLRLPSAAAGTEAHHQ